MAPGTMIWVPVNRSETAAKPEKQEKQEKEEKQEKTEKTDKSDYSGKSKGKGDAKNGGKAEAKGGKSSKGEGKSYGGKADGKGSGKESKDDVAAKGKGKDWGYDWGKGDYKGVRDDWVDYGYIEYKAESKGDAKGKSKGKGKPAGKGKGKGKGEDQAPQPSGGVKWVQDLEADLTKASKTPVVRQKRGSDGVSKSPIDAKGKHCEVRKHSGMGCAVVSMDSANAREAVMRYVERQVGGSDKPAKTEIGNVVVQLRRHQDKTTHREVLTDIFVAWGHKQEKENPLEADELAEAFDNLLVEAQQSGGAHLTAPTQGSGTLSTVPQQVLPLRSPTAAPPPPPAHLPAVGLPAGYPQIPLPQTTPVHPSILDYQRAAMMNSWMVNPALNPFLAQPQQPIPPALAAQSPGWQHAAALQQLHLQQQQLLLLQQQQAQQAQQAQQPAQLSSPLASSPAAAAAPPSPSSPPQPEAPSATAADYAPAKPRLLAIVDPQSGAKIDTLGMNFEPRKPRSPLKIINPSSGEAVNV